jgi:polyribonucleotide nucleotidyltransferase
VRAELKEGEQIMVKVINFDPSGKVRLSRKALLQDAGGSSEAGASDGGQREHREGHREHREGGGGHRRPRPRREE